MAKCEHTRLQALELYWMLFFLVLKYVKKHVEFFLICLFHLLVSSCLHGVLWEHIPFYVLGSQKWTNFSYFWHFFVYFCTCLLNHNGNIRTWVLYEIKQKPDFWPKYFLVLSKFFSLSSTGVTKKKLAYPAFYDFAHY